YGPSGSAWSTADPSAQSQNFLAQLTMAEYKAEQNGTLQIPLGPTSKYPMPMQAYQQVEQGLAQYDPLSALLAADAQNKTAALQLLGGKDGSTLSCFLLNGAGPERAAAGQLPRGLRGGYRPAGRRQLLGRRHLRAARRRRVLAAVGLGRLQHHQQR